MNLKPIGIYYEKNNELVFLRLMERPKVKPTHLVLVDHVEVGRWYFLKDSTFLSEIGEYPMLCVWSRGGKSELAYSKDGNIMRMVVAGGDIWRVDNG